MADPDLSLIPSTKSSELKSSTNGRRKGAKSGPGVVGARYSTGRPNSNQNAISLMNKYDASAKSKFIKGNQTSAGKG